MVGINISGSNGANDNASQTPWQQMGNAYNQHNAGTVNQLGSNWARQTSGQNVFGGGTPPPNTPTGPAGGGTGNGGGGGGSGGGGGPFDGSGSLESAAQALCRAAAALSSAAAALMSSAKNGGSGGSNLPPGHPNHPANNNSSGLMHIGQGGSPLRNMMASLLPAGTQFAPGLGNFGMAGAVIGGIGGPGGAAAGAAIGTAIAATVQAVKLVYEAPKMAKVLMEQVHGDAKPWNDLTARGYSFARGTSSENGKNVLENLMEYRKAERGDLDLGANDVLDILKTRGIQSPDSEQGINEAIYLRKKSMSAGFSNLDPDAATLVSRQGEGLNLGTYNKNGEQYVEQMRTSLADAVSKGMDNARVLQNIQGGIESMAKGGAIGIDTASTMDYMMRFMSGQSPGERSGAIAQQNSEGLKDVMGKMGKAPQETVQFLQAEKHFGGLKTKENMETALGKTYYDKSVLENPAMSEWKEAWDAAVSSGDEVAKANLYSMVAKDAPTDNLKAFADAGMGDMTSHMPKQWQYIAKMTGRGQTSPIMEKGEGGPNTAMEFFMSPEGGGYGRDAAAALAASAKRESGFNPAAIGDNGQAVGMYQWHSDRASAIEKKFGKRVIDMTATEQMQAKAWELSPEGPEARAGRDLRGAGSANSAGIIDSLEDQRPGKFVNGQFIPNIAEARARGDLAQQYATGRPLDDSTVPKDRNNLEFEYKQIELEVSKIYANLNTEVTDITKMFGLLAKGTGDLTEVFDTAYKKIKAMLEGKAPESRAMMVTPGIGMGSAPH